MTFNAQSYTIFIVFLQVDPKQFLITFKICYNNIIL